MNPPAREDPAHRLLVVDDDRDYADAVCQLLRLTCDWKVDVAYGPAQALSAVAALAPDAVMMDLEMAGQSGFETADRLLEAAAGRRPVLVAMTGNSRLQLDASHDLRFSKALLKPFDTPRLLALLDEVARPPAAR